MAFSDSSSVRLADLGDCFNGVNYSKEAMGSGSGVINVTDIFKSGVKLNLTDLDKVDLSDLKRVDRYTVQKNDLFFVRSSVKRDGVGLVSYSPRTDPSVVHCGFVIRFRVRDERANPLFLAYALRSPYYRETLKNLSSGTAIVNISQSSIGSVGIDLPPRPLQDRLVGILSAYDDLIENNTRRIKVLEDMAQMLYREWFVNFRFPGHEKVRMVESELGPIPEGWTVERLEAVVEEFIDYRGKTPTKLGGEWSQSGITALSALNVKHGRLINLDKSKFVNEELYEKWMKSKLRAGDVLMTSEAPLGEVYFLPETRRYCLSQRVFAIRSKTDVMQSSLLFFFLSSAEGQEQLKKRASGTTVLGIRQADLRRIPLVRPKIDVQRKGDLLLRPFLTLLDKIQSKNANLRTTRDFLLPKLISGEIPVEDAAEVMEQIA